MKVYLEIHDVSGNTGRKLTHHYMEVDTLKGEYIEPHSMVKRQLEDFNNSKINIQLSKLWCHIYRVDQGNIFISCGNLEKFELEGLNCLETVVLGEKDISKLNELLKD